MSDWIGSEHVDSNRYIGFVYRITRISDGRFYIGKKLLTSTRTKKKTKKELLAEPKKPGRQSLKKKVVSESDWKSYWGSDEELKKDVKLLGSNCFIREILHLCRTKKQLTYYEEREQYTHRVLEQGVNSYNKNIAGRLFRRDISDSSSIFSVESGT